jgi:hypothetical protein
MFKLRELHVILLVLYFLVSLLSATNVSSEIALTIAPSPRFYKIVTTSENYPVVLSKLQEEGIKFETDNGYELLPLNPVEVFVFSFIVA